MFLRKTSLLKSPLKCFTSKSLITKPLFSNLNIFSSLDKSNSKNLLYFNSRFNFTTKQEEQKEKDNTGKASTENKEKNQQKSADSKKKEETTSSSSSSSEDESVSLDKYMELKKEYLEIASKTEQFKKKFEEARKAYIDNKEETDQMRKRLEKENNQIKEHAITKFSKDLLDVCDNFDKALESIKDKDFDKLNNQEKIEVYNKFIEGVSATQSILANTLKKHGVTEFNPVNEKFDPNKHDAVFDYLDEEKTPGTVGTVINCGYLISERVLRPAKVGIIKKKV